MKKIILAFLLLLNAALPANAVLKEKDLAETLCVLKAELQEAKKEQVENTRLFGNAFDRFSQRMLEFMQNADKTSLMLYSQKEDYVFDLTYACHEATEQYRTFNSRISPFSLWVDKITIEINRYAALINSLEKMPDFILKTVEAKEERKECIEIATSIRNQMIINKGKIEELIERQNRVKNRLKELNDYAKARYDKIRTNIFVNGGENYITILSNFKVYYMQAVRSMSQKYTPNKHTNSSWRGPIVIFLFSFILLYLLIGSALSWVTLKWFIPKSFKDEHFKERRPCMVLCSTIILFAIIVMLLNWLTMPNNYFFHMAASHLIEYALLMAVMLVSILVRMWKHPERIKRAFRIYLPVFILGFIVIVFRIIFIPNEVVNLIFPPILIIFTVWQIFAIYKHNKNDNGKISKYDYFYAYISLGVIIFCTLSSLWGYTLFAVQILIWWYMQLTCIQSVTCVYTLLHIYQAHKIELAKKKAAEVKEKTKEIKIAHAWVYDLVYKVIIPVISVNSMLISIYWAAMVFDLTEICKTIFLTRYIDVPGYLSISIFKLSVIVSLFFIFRYIIFLSKDFYKRTKKRKHGNDNGVVGLGLNVISIIGWGIYILMSMKILNISNSGLLVALGGMSTGLGFAMKDTIENLFYGVSLMTGRVRVGDMIELEGVRGRVANITYQSTLVETLDGSIMAFLNSQLFTKNFKNLTKNHGYEMVKIPVGVAYGTNVENVRQMLTSKISTLECYNKKRPVQVIFNDFGESSVDLFLIVWVPVNTKLTAVAQIKESVYEVLNENHIEIPFPQRDIYIRKYQGIEG